MPAGRYLLWSDIPNDRMLRWDETTGHVGVFRSPAGNSNGNTLDRQGRLITCEQGNRRVTRTEHDGSITVLAEDYGGKRLNSPNDAAVAADGAIFLSDPDFGINSDYEGNRGDSEIGACNVYRLGPTTTRSSSLPTVSPARMVWSSLPTEAVCTCPTAGRTTSACSLSTARAR